MTNLPCPATGGNGQPYTSPLCTPSPSQLLLTGLAFVDNNIVGQHRGDANGILGVRGGGKTTLGIDIALANAKQAYLEGMTTGTKPQLSVFLSYEEPESKVLPRIWSNGCSIRWSKLEELMMTQNWNVLSTTERLEDYEREFQHATGPDAAPLSSELQRWYSALSWMNASFAMLDMSGSEKYPGAGAGYVDEIVAVLSRLCDERGVGLRCVTIDYAGLLPGKYDPGDYEHETVVRMIRAEAFQHGVTLPTW